MILKERLEELIKEKATIYYIFDDVIFNTKEIIPIKLNDGASFDISTAFETEEDARWELEMTATRTETLRLPKWEEIIHYYSLEFSNTRFEVDIIKNRILVKTDKNYLDLYDYIFDKPATKENYIKACKLCLRLFKGEEV